MAALTFHFHGDNLHNIQAIANYFITVNKFSELLRKVRFTYNFSKSVHRKILIPIYLVAEGFSD